MTARGDWVDRARAIRLEDELARRGILKGLRGRSGELAGPCPLCAGRDRFAVNTRKQVFLCRQCFPKGGGGAISFVMFLDGCEFLEAVETLTAEPRPDREQETAAERRAREQLAPERRERLDREWRQRKKREAAQACETLRYCGQLWAQTEPLPPEAFAYFARRGISLDQVPEYGGLRWHPCCPFGGPVLPCIVARFSDPITTTPAGIWRRPLSGEKPKTVGPMQGPVIRLWPDADVTTGLVVGEGIETTLAAATRITHHGTFLQPAWACACAGNMAKFPVLSGIEHLTVLADADEAKRNKHTGEYFWPGQDAARACAKRWAAAGLDVEVLIPDELGADFNDLIRAAL